MTAYRTVRAAPPPAPTRDAIKTGKFDAVVFTSSSTVRNLVGIAGKPHPSTVIAVIGPATAKTAEEHGLRVDVMAPKPDVEVLAEALAGFGASRRAAPKSASASVSTSTSGFAARTSTRRPCSSAVLAVAGPITAITVEGWGFPAIPTRLRTVEDEVKTTASNLPVLIASRVAAGGGAARTVR